MQAMNRSGRAAILQALPLTRQSYRSHSGLQEWLESGRRSPGRMIPVATATTPSEAISGAPDLLTLKDRPGCASRQTALSKLAVAPPLQRRLAALLSGCTARLHAICMVAGLIMLTACSTGPGLDEPADSGEEDSRPSAIEPDNPDYLDTRGWLRCKRGDVSAGQADLERAIDQVLLQVVAGLGEELGVRGDDHVIPEGVDVQLRIRGEDCVLLDGE